MTATGSSMRLKARLIKLIGGNIPKLTWFATNKKANNQKIRLVTMAVVPRELNRGRRVAYTHMIKMHIAKRMPRFKTWNKTPLHRISKASWKILASLILKAKCINPSTMISTKIKAKPDTSPARIRRPKLIFFTRGLLSFRLDLAKEISILQFMFKKIIPFIWLN